MLHLKLNIATELLNCMVEHIHSTYSAYGGFAKFASVNSPWVTTVGILIPGSPHTNCDEPKQMFADQAGPTKVQLTNLVQFLKEPDTLAAQCQQ